MQEIAALRRAVLLPRTIMLRLEKARILHLPQETGGFLIGLRRGPHIEITGATEQASGDVATGRSFERSDERHAQEIEAAWRGGYGLTSVVGDWHSHPFGDGNPSGQDHHAWRKLSKANNSDCVGLIFGTSLIPRVFCTFRHRRISKISEYILLAEENDVFLFSIAT